MTCNTIIRSVFPVQLRKLIRRRDLACHLTMIDLQVRTRIRRCLCPSNYHVPFRLLARMCDDYRDATTFFRQWNNAISLDFRSRHIRTTSGYKFIHRSIQFPSRWRTSDRNEEVLATVTWYISKIVNGMAGWLHRSDWRIKDCHHITIHLVLPTAFLPCDVHQTLFPIQSARCAGFDRAWHDHGRVGRWLIRAMERFSTTGSRWYHPSALDE